MIKLYPNRTIGLQRKAIEDSFSEADCKTCEGKGSYVIQMRPGSIRNLKGKSGLIALHNDCNNCDHGKVRTKLRIIRKNHLSIIL
jgi:hypothetical protein